MSEDLDLELDDQQDGPKGLRDAHRREKERADAAEARLQDLERREAFRDAGVDLSNPLHAAAIKGYDGAPDGINEWVTNLGLTSANTVPPNPEVPADEQDALDRMFSASAGDGGAQTADLDSDKNRELAAINDQARREGWDKNRWQEAFTAAMTKHNSPVSNMQIEQQTGARR